MKKFYASLAALLAIVSTVVALNFGIDQSQAAWNGQDCTSNAIIKCGAHTRDALKNKVNGSTELKNLYNYFGISPTMISSGTIKEGVVHKNGNVTVGNQVVATNAWSVGREYRAPDSESFKVGNKTYYKRPTSNPNIFAYGSMTAFVFYDKNGKYVGTIIKSCGNPVFATAKPPKPQPKPVGECASLSRVKESETTYKFIGKSRVADGAKHKGFTFEFGDGKSRYVAVERTTDNGKYGYADARYTYSKSGTYNVKVTAHFTINGKEVKHTQSNCAKPVTIKVPEPPKPKPAAECVSLKAERVGTSRTNFKFVANASTKNGATISQYTFTAPGMNKVVRTTSKTANTTHNFTNLEPGTYTAKVVVKTSVGDKTGKNCEVKFTIPAKPKPQPEPKKPGVSIDKQVSADKKDSGMTKEQALEQARNFKPKTNCTTVMTPAIHIETGARYTFTSGCLPAGWVAERNYQGNVGSGQSYDWAEHAKLKVNQEFAYKLVVKNTGEVTLKNARVTDPAPNGVQFLSADKGSVTNNQWSYTIPELKPNASLTVVIKAKVTKYVEGRITNTACVDAKEVPGDKDDCDDATVEVEEPPKEEPPVEEPPKEEPPVEEPKPVEVCDLDKKEVVEITEEELKANPDRYTTVLSECDEEEVLGEEAPKKGEETPEVIAATGPAAIIGGLFGSSALGLGITGYVRSRRALSNLLG